MFFGGDLLGVGGIWFGNALKWIIGGDVFLMVYFCLCTIDNSVCDSFW